MSVDSGLIVRRDALPEPAELAAATKELTGVTVVFHSDFRLADWGGGWVPVTVDGEESGFEYYPGPLGEAEELPDGAQEHGDHLLWFVARGALSAQTVSLLQRTLAARWNAAGLIEGELFPPGDMAVESEPPADMDPDLAATMTGTPKERAAAMERYVAKHYPPIPVDPHARTKDLLKQLIVPILIFAALGGFYLWSQLK